MKIDRRKIKVLEQLARIELHPDEIEVMAGQLDRIVEFVSQLRAADRSGAVGTGFVARGAAAGLREDEVREGLGRDGVAKIAPAFENGFFRVPRILDKEES